MPPKIGDASLYALQRLSAVLMTLGPGSAMGFYCALAGFYIERFRSPAFFIWMVISCVIPGPLVSFLQYNFDEVFDRRFSTSATYVFRVVALQLVLAMLAFVWMLMPQLPWTVLSMGLCVGFISSSIVSSSSQMVGALNPSLNVDSNIGRLLGSAFPVAVFFVLGFTPRSPPFVFKLALLTIPATCFASSAVLWYVHSSTSALAKSYRRLSYSLGESIPESAAEDTPGEDGELEAPRWERCNTETQPLQPVEGDEVPSWVWCWFVCSGTLTMLAVMLMSLCGFFGDAHLAQSLSLAKLATDLFGVLFALPLSSLPCFEEGPWHSTLALCITLYSLLFIHLLSVLHGGGGPGPLFLASWLSFFFISATVAPHIAVTVGAYVKVKDRKRVLLMNTASINTGYFLGSGIAAAFVLAGMFNLTLS